MKRKAMMLTIAGAFGALALSGCERAVDGPQASRERPAEQAQVSPRAEPGYTTPRELEPKAPPTNSEETLKNPTQIQGQVDPRQAEQRRDFEKR